MRLSNKKIFTFSLLTVFFAFGIFQTTFAQSIKLQIPLPGMGEIKVCDGAACSGIAEYIKTIAKWIVGSLSMLATLFIMIGGLIWLTARANPKQAEFAKKLVTDSLWGLILALGSYMLLATISPSLTSFSPLSVQQVEKVDFEVPTMNPNLEEIKGTAPKEIVDRINQVMPVYKQVAAEKGMPWQLLAGVHFQEGGNRLDKSILNGKALCNNDDGSRCAACNNGETLINDIRCGAGVIIQKANTTYPVSANFSYTDRSKKFNLSSLTSADASDPHGAAANISMRYNGVCPKNRQTKNCMDITENPYPMNNFDSQHTNMSFCAYVSKKDHTLICRNWGSMDGILAFEKRLYNPANYVGGDINGKLLQLK